MAVMTCQCEHGSHFPDTGERTPAGHPGHRYGELRDASSMVWVKTPYGRFRVCRDCAQDCYKEYPEIKSEGA